MKTCGCDNKSVNVGFPDCGCHYTIDDNGIHMCPLHASAEHMKEFIEKVARSKTFMVYEAKVLLKEIGE